MPIHMVWLWDLVRKVKRRWGRCREARDTLNRVSSISSLASPLPLRILCRPSSSLLATGLQIPVATLRLRRRWRIPRTTPLSPLRLLPIHRIHSLQLLKDRIDGERYKALLSMKYTLHIPFHCTVHEDNIFVFETKVPDWVARCESTHMHKWVIRFLVFRDSGPCCMRRRFWRVNGILGAFAFNETTAIGIAGLEWWQLEAK